MIDQAGIMMAQGAEIACERIAGVNDNMTQPHYHNYYELYYLEKGERYQRLQDELYVLKPGELMLFSPYIMHYSYGKKDMPFRRIVLYFRREDVDVPELASLLDQANGMYSMGLRDSQMIHRILGELCGNRRRKRIQKRMSALSFESSSVSVGPSKAGGGTGKNRAENKNGAGNALYSPPF